MKKSAIKIAGFFYGENLYKLNQNGIIIAKRFFDRERTLHLMDL